MNRTFLTAFTLMSLVSASAIAQNTATTAGGGGIMMSDHAKAVVHYVTTKPADTMSSKLVGASVYNNQNEKIGEVEDLVIDNGKTISGVVVSVGGFLGMGEHYVLIDPASMVMSNKSGTMTVMVDTSKDNLKAAPSFSYAKQSNKKS